MEGVSTERYLLEKIEVIDRQTKGEFVAYRPLSERSGNGTARLKTTIPRTDVFTELQNFCVEVKVLLRKIIYKILRTDSDAIQPSNFSVVVPSSN